MTFHKRICLLLLSFCFLSRPLFAQETLYSFAFINLPLQDALEQLIQHTDISLFYENELVANKQVYCKVSQKPIKAVLACILKGTGLDYMQLSTGTFVLKTAVQAPPAYGQISGFVYDAETQQPLPEAHVVISSSRLGQITSQAGFFIFSEILPGTYVISVSYLGYEPAIDTLHVQTRQKRSLRIALKSKPIITHPIVINGNLQVLNSSLLGLGKITLEELEQKVPTPSGALQEVNAISGIHINNTTSEIYIQGGDDGQNELLLDGAKVLIPVVQNRFLGPFSALAIDKFTIYKAGFGVTKGSYLSGVIETDLKLDASQEKFQLQIDPLSFDASWHRKRTSKFGRNIQTMTAFRRDLQPFYTSYYLDKLFKKWAAPDIFLISTQTNIPDTLLTTFSSLKKEQRVELYDFHTAVQVRTPSFRTFQASFYLGRSDLRSLSRFFDEDEAPTLRDTLRYLDNLKWFSTSGQVRYEGMITNRTFMRGQLWASAAVLWNPVSLSGLNYFGEEAPENTFLSLNNESNVSGESGFRFHIDHIFNRRHDIQTGLEGFLGFSFLSEFPIRRTLSETYPISIKRANKRLSAFWEDHLKLTNTFHSDLGLRATFLDSNRKIYFEPRFAFRYDLGKNMGLRFAGGLYRQFVNQIDIPTFNVNPLSTRLRFWLPISNDLEPPKVHHLNIGWLYKFSPTWQFTLEGFFKDHALLWELNYASLIKLPENEPLSSESQLLVKATGYSFGIATEVQKQTNTYHILFNYTYGATYQRIENRYKGALIPLSQHIPHQARLVCDYFISENLISSIRWEGLAGRFGGFRQTYYDLLEPDEKLPIPFNFSTPQFDTLPPFSQWDIGIAYNQNFKTLKTQTRLSLINVFDRKNIEDWGIAYNPETNRYEKFEREVMPFMMALSLKFSW